MSSAFQKKYGAGRFDPDSRNDEVAESARRAVLRAYSQSLAETADADRCAPREMEMLVAGLLVGVVQVARTVAVGAGRDYIDTVIRNGICQISGWAVDHARAMDGLDPLPDAALAEENRE